MAPRDREAEEQARHPLYRRIAQVLELPIPTAPKLVLISLARHGDWTDGTSCRPAERTIAREASMSVRNVRRVLSRLWCRADAPCIGERPCQHWGLIELEEPHRYGRPSTWALNLAPTLFQLHMPEVGSAAAAPEGFLAPAECSVLDCAEPVHARGYCSRHYKRWQRHGDAVAEGRQGRFGPRRVGTTGDVRTAGGELAPAPWKEAAG